MQTSSAGAERQGDEQTARLSDASADESNEFDGPHDADPSPPTPPTLARRHYPMLERLARTYRLGAWVSLVAGPLIGVMALTSSLDGAGRLLWILLVAAATALMFVTWHATSEMILVVLGMGESLRRSESQVVDLQKRISQLADRDSEGSERKAPRGGRKKTRRARQGKSRSATRAAGVEHAPDQGLEARKETA